MSTTTILSVAAVSGLLLWLLGAGRRPGVIPPEDDVDTPLDEDELARAERELRDDPAPRPINEALEDDDWGPGAGGSSLPGIL